MNTDFRIRANFYTREAWKYLGRAREDKRQVSHARDPFVARLKQQQLQDSVRLARGTMHLVLTYRKLANA